MQLHRSLPLVLAAFVLTTLVPATSASPATGPVCVQDTAVPVGLADLVCASTTAAIASAAGWARTCVLAATGNVDCHVSPVNASHTTPRIGGGHEVYVPCIGTFVLCLVGGWYVPVPPVPPIGVSVTSPGWWGTVTPDGATPEVAGHGHVTVTVTVDGRPFFVTVPLNTP